MSRLGYAGLALATIALGLAIHRHGHPLGRDLRDILGDALWAAMVFWWLSAIGPGWPSWRRATAAVAFSWLIELTQRLHPPWLDAIRRTTPGQLVLGSGFDARDLLSYLAGVIAAVAIDAVLRRRAS